MSSTNTYTRNLTDAYRQWWSADRDSSVRTPFVLYDWRSKNWRVYFDAHPMLLSMLVTSLVGLALLLVEITSGVVLSANVRDVCVALPMLGGLPFGFVALLRLFGRDRQRRHNVGIVELALTAVAAINYALLFSFVY